MTYEQKLSMQGVEVTLRLNYTNEVVFDLILTSESGEKLAVNGSLTQMKEASQEKEYEERVKEEKFSTAYLSQKLKSINTCSTFEEKKTSFIECMTYLYAHREAIVRYTSFLDIMTNKCYEIKEGNPTDSELNGVCDKILTHFGLETDMEVYLQKKAALLKEKEEDKKEEDKKQEEKKERAVQKYREEQKRDQIYLRAVQKCQEEHLELLAKAVHPYHASRPVEPRLKELFKLEEQRWEQEQQEKQKQEEVHKKQEEVHKKQEEVLKTELVVQKYREEVKRDEPLVKAFLKDREDHLQLLEKVANTYDIPFTKKMYDQYLDWKVTYRGNAKNRYKRMCEFMESLPLFQ
jgi:hypothetical protein